MDNEMIACLLRLEAKQVERGYRSEVFPEMDREMATFVRCLTLDQLKEFLNKNLPEGGSDK